MARPWGAWDATIQTTPVVDRHRAAGLYYGWWLLLALAWGQVTSWGILYYGFAVFVGPMERDLGWSRSALTGAFSLALLCSGVAGLGVGWWVDRHGRAS